MGSVGTVGTCVDSGSVGTGTVGMCVDTGSVGTWVDSDGNSEVGTLEGLISWPSHPLAAGNSLY